MNQRTRTTAGMRYGRWTVIREAGRDTSNAILWVCRCDCGTVGVARGYRLRSGRSRSCGCLRVDTTTELKRVDLTGQRFGRLIVKQRLDSTAKHGHTRWVCRCDCGERVTVSNGNLTSGHTQSCGCLAQDVRRNRRGESRTDAPAYRSAHTRVVSARGRAAEYRCVDCQGMASEWSYDHGDPNEALETDPRGRTLAYSYLVEHYDPRCGPCHRRFDAERGIGDRRATAAR